MNYPYTDPTIIRQKNSSLEAAGLEWLGFRLPSLRVEVYFYYKLVEDERYSVGVHGHDYWEMSRLMCGSAKYTVQTDSGEHSFDPDPEHFLLIPPRFAHKWELTEGPLLLNSWQIRMTPEDSVGEELLGLLEQHTVLHGFQSEVIAYQAQAEDLLWNITAERYSPGVMGPMISGIARVITGGLLGALKSWPQELSERENKMSQNAENLANKLRDFMEANLHHPITLVDLESHFHYSSRHLNRIFQQTFKTSIGHYLRDRRFEIATRWLATTNRSIKDIALSLGYGNISHFCRYFRKRKNLSPTEYREQGAQRVERDTFITKS